MYKPGEALTMRDLCESNANSLSATTSRSPFNHHYIANLGVARA